MSLRAWLKKARPYARKAWPFIKVAVAGLLLVGIALQVEWDQFLGLAGQVDVAWLFLILFVIVVDRAFMAFKWHYLLKGLGVNTRLSEVLYQYYLAGIIGTATQWAPSGDLSRAIAVGKDAGTHPVVGASVVLEKMGGLAGSGALATVAIVLLVNGYELGQWHQPILIVGIVTAASTVIGLASFWPSLLDRFVKMGGYAPWPRVKAVVSDIGSATKHLRGRPTGRIFLAMTFVEQLAPIIVLYLLSEAFGFGLPVLLIVSVFPIIQFLTRLPLSLETFGVREALFVYLFGLVGVSTEVSFALTLADRVMTASALGVGILACYAFKWKRPGSGSPEDE